MISENSRHGDLPSTWLQRAAEAHGERLGLALGRRTFSYAELHERVARLGAAMSRQGLEPGSPVVIVSERTERIAWALHLALYTGFALWPLDPRRGDLHEDLRNAGKLTALVDDGLVMPESMRCLDSALLDQSPSGEPASPRLFASSHVQLILATSGSTGAPRGVMLTVGNLAAAAAASRERLGLGSDDIWLACLPLYHVGGLSILLRCLEAGAGVVLHDRFDAERVWSALRTYAVTHLSLVPSMLEALLTRGPTLAPPPSLRVVLLGGGPIAEAMVHRALDAGWPICPSYGMSENASQVATLCPASRDWVAGDAGRPLESVCVDVVDETGKPTAGRGRIRIGGPTVMAGYVNPAWTCGDGLVDGTFTSSDIGYLDDRGHLHVLGRIDDVIVSGGENVMPQQVERLLLECKGVVDVAVVGVDDSVWGQRIVAVFSGVLEASELEHWCRTRMPSSLRPRTFLRVDDLPRNPMGKLDRQALRRRAADELKR